LGQTKKTAYELYGSMQALRKMVLTCIFSHINFGKIHIQLKRTLSEFVPSRSKRLACWTPWRIANKHINTKREQQQWTKSRTMKTHK